MKTLPGTEGWVVPRSGLGIRFHFRDRSLHCTETVSAAESGCPGEKKGIFL